MCYDEEGHLFPAAIFKGKSLWSDYRNDTTYRVIAVAEANGSTVLYPSDKELFIDIDTKEQYQLMKERLARLPNMLFMKAAITRDVPSASGGDHRHVTLEISEELPAEIRAAIQMFLCSDPVREILAIRRVLQGVTNPIIFIEGGNWKKV